MPDIRGTLRFLFRRIVAIYFRDVEIAGDVPDPDTGGRLFAANHVNALVDPILVLTQAPCNVSPVAKSTLWKIPGLSWLLDAADAVPIVRKRDDPTKTAKDNDAIFDRVGEHLARGGNILIFPEGTSHNEPHLLALRSGAGRMLARAGELAGKLAAPSRDLTFQAVALEFDDREVFRSRALVLFGPVRRVASVVPEVAAPAEEQAKAITEALRADLSELLVEGATWEERVLIIHVAEMFANDAEDRTLAQINQLGRRIEQARSVLGTSAPEDVRAIEKRVAEYWSELEAAEVTDALVARHARRMHAREGRGEGEDTSIAPERIALAALRILTVPLAAAGMVLYWLPYQLPRAVTRRLGGDPDISSTYKLGVGLLVHPLWAAIAISLAVMKLPASDAALAIAVVLTSPFAALPWLDRWDRLAARLRLLAPWEERRDVVTEIAARRTALMRALEAARDRAEGATEETGIRGQRTGNRE